LETQVQKLKEKWKEKKEGIEEENKNNVFWCVSLEGL